jgi:hypothetical protein
VWRRATGEFRVLPTFVIIGAQRAGTSSLYRWLCQHPAVRRATRKELHYFDANLDRGETWYRSHFPLAASMSTLHARYGAAATGEASPLYLADPEVPERLDRLLPDARLIVLLRDPVERAISHYFHEVDEGREHLPIDEAMEVDRRRLQSFSPGSNYGYIGRGRYADQIRRWRKVVPLNRMLVLRSEDMFADPTGTVDAALHFVGVDPSQLSAQRYHALNALDRGAERVPLGVRDLLREEFGPSNADLERLLGARFRWGEPLHKLS